VASASAEPPSRRIDLAIAAVAIVLIATMLYEPPLAELNLTSSSSFLVHSWDLAWMLLAGVAVAAVIAHRSKLRSVFLIRRLPWRDPIVAVGVLAIFGTASLAWSYTTFGTSGLSASVVQCLRLFMVVTLSMLVRSLASDRVRNTIVWTFLGVSLIAALWAVIAWRGETTVYHVGLRVVRVGVTRAGGPFGNWFASGSSDSWWAPPGSANGLGFWLAVAIPVSLTFGLARRRMQRIAATLALASVPILVVGLLATHSRESWLATLVAGGVLFWPTLRRVSVGRKLIVTLGTLAAAAVVVVALPIVSSRVSQSFSPGTFDYQSGPQARTAAWSLGLHWSEERFPIGWGIGAIEEHPAQFGGHTTAENVYLQYLAQLGIVGFVALVAISIQGLRLGFRRFLKRPKDLSSMYAAAFFAALIAHGMFGNTLGDPTIQILLACALGLCIRSAPARGDSSRLMATEADVSVAAV
jgi:O-antigen ligase